MNKEGVAHQCIACRAEIILGALKCKACGAHQSRWMNWLTYISTVAGGLGILAGAGVFVVSSWDSVRRVLAWQDDLTVLSLSLQHYRPGFSLSVANTGDGDLQLLTLSYSIKSMKVSQSSMTRDLTDNIQSGKTLVIKDDEIVAKREFKTVAVKSDKICQDVVAAILNNNSCGDFAIFSNDHPGYQIFKRAHDSIGAVMCEKIIAVELVAFSPKTRKPLSTTIMSKAVVLFNGEDPKCLSK